MPVTRTYEVYAFDEHPNQQAVLNKYRDINTEYGWWDSTVEDIVTLGALMGLFVGDTPNDVKMFYFTDFHYQSGCAYWGGNMYLANMADAAANVKGYAPGDEVVHALAARCEKLLADAPPRVRNFVVLCEKGYTEVQGEFTDVGEEDDDAAQALEVDAQSIASTFSEWAYKRLQAEYEYLQSDEVLVETFTGNEYMFKLDGRFDHGG